MSLAPASTIFDDQITVNCIGRIPVRNLWLLMLYASDLFRHLDKGKIDIERNPDDIPDLIAEYLTRVVERRLMRNLSFGYRARSADLRRVRGRIDLLRTERHQLLDRGQVACRFDELTVNTPRNCFVRSALEKIAKIVKRRELTSRCLTLASTLRRIGVTGEKPSRLEISTDRFGHHDADDQLMIMVAKLAFDLALPTELSGVKRLTLPDREISWVRRLYEKAVAGFFDVVLSPSGWRTEAGKCLKWRIEEKTDGIDNILPSMRTDIILTNNQIKRKIVIDTKFTSIVTKGLYREEVLKSGYIYQIYAYLRSQEGSGNALTDKASGLLLHPSIEEMIDESVIIQGHTIRFATVNLAATASVIREQLLRAIN